MMGYLQLSSKLLESHLILVDWQLVYLQPVAASSGYMTKFVPFSLVLDVSFRVLVKNAFGHVFDL